MPDFNYDVVGGTRPAEAGWSERPAGYRRFERTVRVGRGTARWEAVADAVVRWQVKIRSGFTVAPVDADSAPVDADSAPVDGDIVARCGAEYELIARFGPVAVREPVRVVAVVDQPARRGFSYGTLPGHPVSGEEAFVAHHSPDGDVWLTLRSLTRSSSGAWRWAFPVLLIAQRHYRGRYLRAFTGMD